MKHDSRALQGRAVTFPEWQGERLYMLPFTLNSGLPREASRFQGTVDQMMDGVSVDRGQECYFMVDEKEVSPGVTHRRPGLHVEGYWLPVLQCHGGGGHVPSKPKHGPQPGHCPTPRHGSISNRGFEKEGVLLASSYASARALLGQYIRDFVADWRGGDCADLETYGLDSLILKGGLVYQMDIWTLHESLPVLEPVRRTLVRINVPTWSPT